MKAFIGFHPDPRDGTGLILLWCGEAAGYKARPDERSLTGILTSGFGLPPAFPPRTRGSGCGRSYPVTVAQPSPIFTGFPVIGLQAAGTAGSHFKERPFYSRAAAV
jgi:hypothetical protein